MKSIPVVSQCMLIGDNRNFCSALLTLDVGAVRGVAARRRARARRISWETSWGAWGRAGKPRSGKRRIVIPRRRPREEYTVHEPGKALVQLRKRQSIPRPSRHRPTRLSGRLSGRIRGGFEPSVVWWRKIHTPTIHGQRQYVNSHTRTDRVSFRAFSPTPQSSAAFASMSPPDRKGAKADPVWGMSRHRTRRTALCGCYQGSCYDSAPATLRGPPRSTR